MEQLHLRQRPGFFHALKANAAFSGVCGLLMLSAPTMVNAWLGAELIALIRSIGLGLVLFAIRLAWIITSGRIIRMEAWGIVVGDLLWVLASAGLLTLFHDQLTPLGWVLTSAVAAAVLTFALLQARGLRPGTSPL